VENLAVIYKNNVSQLYHKCKHPDLPNLQEPVHIVLLAAMQKFALATDEGCFHVLPLA
jgi:hypothetical protein